MFTRQTFYCALLVNLLSGSLLQLRVQAQPSLPAGVQTYVPITITNNQTTATRANFQQMLTINWTTYAQVNSGVTNVEFFDTSGAILMAWCESNASSGDTSSVVWVNLGADTISGAGGKLTIYMGFLSTGTNNMGNSISSVWGEYPTATGTYGEYDNGANVFKNYWNFAGTSLPGDWNTSQVGSVNVNDGISFKSTSGGYDVGQFKDTLMMTRPLILEAYACVSGPYQQLGLTFGKPLASAITAGYGAYWTVWNGTGPRQYLMDYSGSNQYERQFTSTYPSVPSYEIWALVVGLDCDTIKAQINYGNTPATVWWVDTERYDSCYFGISGFWPDKTVYVTWARVRTYPPSGVMPTVEVSDRNYPLQATAFRATAEVGSVTLTWETKSEVDNAGFKILRRDPGTTCFKLISSFVSNGSLRGLGTSAKGRLYAFKDNSVTTGATYQYKVQSVSTSGEVEDLNTMSVTVDVPKIYSLYQNDPNPFNPSTNISYDLPTSTHVKLRIFDVTGHEIATLVDGQKEAGSYSVQWHASNVASGVYFYRLEAGNFVQTKKLMLLK
ncbi:MAG TPA: T9SS type A sorting domain-containing protein [Bacteroidota bacterium]|nr:T9SS type A sorting domain-containing protein [Bacteroidota bacterium]